MIPPYDEKLYVTSKRKFDKETGKPIRHSRWVGRSNVPRYSKPQDTAIAKYIREEKGWHRGARVCR